MIRREDFGVNLGPLLCILAIPAALKFRGHAGGIDRYHTCLHHTRQGNFLRHFRIGTRGVDNGKDFIAFGNGADRREGHANTGDGTGDNQGFAAGRFNGCNKIWIIPGVDFAFARHILRMRGILVDLRDQRAIRTLRY
ncbi:hypothetical protein D3C78_1254100 [compost metagenome]